MRVDTIFSFFRLVFFGLSLCLLSACGALRTLDVSDSRSSKEWKQLQEEAKSVLRNYDYPNSHLDNGSILIIDTISGGGYRAANLGVGHLIALDSIEIDGSRSILDEIDYISTVSGGGLAAALLSMTYLDGSKCTPDWKGKSFIELLELHGRDRLDLLRAGWNKITWDNLSEESLRTKTVTITDLLQKHYFSEFTKKSQCFDRSEAPYTIEEIEDGVNIGIPLHISNSTISTSGHILPFTSEILENLNIDCYVRDKWIRVPRSAQLPYSLGLHASAAFPLVYPDLRLGSSIGGSCARGNFFHLTDGGQSDDNGFLVGLEVLQDSIKRVGQFQKKMFISLDALNAGEALRVDTAESAGWIRVLVERNSNLPRYSLKRKFRREMTSDNERDLSAIDNHIDGGEIYAAHVNIIDEIQEGAAISTFATGTGLTIDQQILVVMEGMLQTYASLLGNSISVTTDEELQSILYDLVYTLLCGDGVERSVSTECKQSLKINKFKNQNNSVGLRGQWLELVKYVQQKLVTKNERKLVTFAKENKERKWLSSLTKIQSDLQTYQQNSRLARTKKDSAIDEVTKKYLSKIAANSKNFEKQKTDELLNTTAQVFLKSAELNLKTIVNDSEQHFSSTSASSNFFDIEYAWRDAAEILSALKVDGTSLDDEIDRLGRYENSIKATDIKAEHRNRTNELYAAQHKIIDGHIKSIKYMNAKSKDDSAKTVIGSEEKLNEDREEGATTEPESVNEYENALKNFDKLLRGENLENSQKKNMFRIAKEATNKISADDGFWGAIVAGGSKYSDLIREFLDETARSLGKQAFLSLIAKIDVYEDYNEYFEAFDKVRDDRESALASYNAAYDAQVKIISNEELISNYCVECSESSCSINPSSQLKIVLVKDYAADQYCVSSIELIALREELTADIEILAEISSFVNNSSDDGLAIDRSTVGYKETFVELKAHYEDLEKHFKELVDLCGIGNDHEGNECSGSLSASLQDDEAEKKYENSRENAASDFLNGYLVDVHDKRLKDRSKQEKLNSLKANSCGNLDFTIPFDDEPQLLKIQGSHVAGRSKSNAQLKSGVGGKKKLSGRLDDIVSNINNFGNKSSKFKSINYHCNWYSRRVRELKDRHMELGEVMHSKSSHERMEDLIALIDDISSSVCDKIPATLNGIKINSDENISVSTDLYKQFLTESGSIADSIVAYGESGEQCATEILELARTHKQEIDGLIGFVDVLAENYESTVLEANKLRGVIRSASSRDGESGSIVLDDVLQRERYCNIITSVDNSVESAEELVSLDVSNVIQNMRENCNVLLTTGQSPLTESADNKLLPDCSSPENTYYDKIYCETFAAATKQYILAVELPDLGVRNKLSITDMLEQQ